VVTPQLLGVFPLFFLATLFEVGNPSLVLGLPTISARSAHPLIPWLLWYYQDSTCPVS